MTYRILIGGAAAFSLLLTGTLVSSCSASGSDLDGGAANGNGTGGSTTIRDLDGGGGTANGSGTGGFGAGETGDYVILTPPGCDEVSFEFESIIPTVMILVDRSSSMFDVPYGPYPNRWQPLKDALVGDGVTYGGVVGALMPAVRFGFAAYTSQKANPLCPLVIGADVPIALNNYAAIRAAYDQASIDPIMDGGGLDLNFKGETPTGEAIGTVLPVLSAFAEAGPKYLLLVTDGQPDTCGLPDPQCGQDTTVYYVQQARQQNIGTFVIGIEMAEFDASRHLTQVANAGQGLPVEQGAIFPNCAAHLASLPGAGTTATYTAPMGPALPYLPSTPEELARDIGYIIGSVRSCTFDLTAAAIDNTRASEGSVQLADQLLGYGDPNGWEMISATTLELKGAACEYVRSTPLPFMHVSFPCDVLIY